MAKLVKVFYKAVVVVLCLAQISVALECLFCKSPDLYSECRLGQRKNKPKLSKCNGPDARCFAMAQIHENNTATFKRGCSIYADFCDKQTDLEFCETCGSTYCNYWRMDVSKDVKDYLGQEEPNYEPTPRPVIKHRRPTPPRIEIKSTTPDSN